MQRFQKAQALVEFAFIFPMLLLLGIGLMYIGFLFSDYIALNEIARSVAREASIVSNTAYDKWEGEDGAYYQAIVSDYVTKANGSGSPSTHFLPNSVYLWDPNSNDVDGGTDANFCVRYDEDERNVVVVLNAPLNQDASGLAGPFKAIVGSVVSNLRVEYVMYSETEWDSTGN